MSLISILTITAALLLGIFWVLKKMIGLNLPPSWGILFIYLGGLIFTLIALLSTRPELKFDISFKKGIILAVGAGALIAAFDFLSLIIFKKGANVALVAPLLSGGAIVVAAVAGLLFFRESINLVQFLGILAVIVGLFLLTR